MSQHRWEEPGTERPTLYFDTYMRGVALGYGVFWPSGRGTSTSCSEAYKYDPWHMAMEGWMGYINGTLKLHASLSGVCSGLLLETVVIH